MPSRDVESTCELTVSLAGCWGTQGHVRLHSVWPYVPAACTTSRKLFPRLAVKVQSLMGKYPLESVLPASPLAVKSLVSW